VDVLAGAFMMMKSETLHQVGGFDEIFFMYGEDVDLSYQIQKAGYKIYYFAESNIIHFKGESTRKGTMNYVRMFYYAMSIFVRKHYSGKRASMFISLIHIAIWIRAMLSAFTHFIRKIGLSLIDAGLILLSFWMMKNIWSQYVRTDIEYERRLLWVAFPAFTALYLITAYYAGLYDRWYKGPKLMRATLTATIILLAGYALLPERFRFSRGILLFGSVLAFLLISLTRWLLIRTRVIISSRDREENASTLIIASQQEYQQVLQLIKEAGMQERILGRIAVNENDDAAVGHWKKINELSSAIPFREIVFCQGQLKFSEIIHAASQLHSGIRVKFHVSGSNSIVGSDSRNTSGEAMSKENGFKLGNPYHRRLKRLIDIIFSIYGILTFPVQLFIIKKPVTFFINCFHVLLAQKTWIGYAVSEKNLPPIRKGVIACNGSLFSLIQNLPPESQHMVDYWYARDYEPANDFKLIWKMHRELGG
ncbi:MAG: glycosyltransferase family 2 protein, partial [Chitinophagaceae bacterium]